MYRPTRRNLEEIYSRLLTKFGPQHWWPGDTPFEIMVGAILTQNTNWSNVEKAIGNLKTAQVLTPEGIDRISVKKLAALIRPSGYFNIKAKRLKNFISFFIREYQGVVKKMRRETLSTLRTKLLSVNGIGPETADSILLYALGKPTFVVDAYTRRFLYRHNFVAHGGDYHHLQDVFSKHLPADVKMFNEYHALIVHLGKEKCKTNPLCEECPLNNFYFSKDRRCLECHRSLLKDETRCRSCS